MEFPFRTSTPSQSEIFSLKAVIVACSLCSYTVAFQDQHTLPKRNILSHSCYCGLLSLLVYSGLPGPAHPPKEKYSLSQLLLWLALSARIQWPSRTSTPSQREIFSQSCYCGLLVWSFLSGPAHPPKEKYSLTAVIVACSVYLHFRTSTPSQSEIFSLTAVIVTCSMYLHFRTSTPSQSEIFSQTYRIYDTQNCKQSHCVPSRGCLSIWHLNGLVHTL